MAALELWRLARPWTPAEWAEIVQFAREIRERRQEARAARRAARTTHSWTASDLAMDQALRYEFQAREREARLRYLADVRGKDLDPEAIARLDVSPQK